MIKIYFFFSMLFIEFPTYGKNLCTFLTNKTKKIIKSKKYTDFGGKPGKLAFNLMDITKVTSSSQSQSSSNHISLNKRMN